MGERLDPDLDSGVAQEVELDSLRGKRVRADQGGSPQPEPGSRQRRIGDPATQPPPAWIVRGKVASCAGDMDDVEVAAAAVS